MTQRHSTTTGTSMDVPNVTVVIEMEELIKRLAELQAEHEAEEAAADAVSSDVDSMIASTEQDLIDLKDTRRILRQPQEISMGELDVEIEGLKGRILNAWNGEKKTMVFGDRVPKFTTRGSLNIINELYLFAELYDHVTIDELVKKYLKGFNLTAVKKYMGVHDLPIDVAEIEYKTTVKLEQESGWCVRVSGGNDGSIRRYNSCNG